MYEIFKNVINSGRFELSDMLTKIDTIWLQGDLTGEQKAELIDLAREKAIPENSYASVQRQLDILFENFAELSERVLVLESGSKPSEEEWPEYVRPTGVHDAYNTGDKITFKGEHYTCIATEGIAVVWDPETYPTYWQKEMIE